LPFFVIPQDNLNIMWIVPKDFPYKWLKMKKGREDRFEVREFFLKAIERFHENGKETFDFTAAAPWKKAEKVRITWALRGRGGLSERVPYERCGEPIFFKKGRFKGIKTE